MGGNSGIARLTLNLGELGRTLNGVGWPGNPPKLTANWGEVIAWTTLKETLSLRGGAGKVFDLTGNFKAKRAFGWSHPDGCDNKTERFVAKLEIPSVDSRRTAIKMTIYSGIRKGKIKGQNMKPRLLDLFCCAGGVAVGYNRAGFEVVGVDIDPQPHFPFEFIHADAMTLPIKFLKSFDAIHASPPCQSYSDLAKRNGNAHEWPRLIEPVREMLIRTGKPYIIENVDGAPLINPAILCGTMFKGLRVLRHRLFEANFLILTPPHGKHPRCHTFDKRKSQYGKTNDMIDFVSVNGGGNCTIAAARDAMGIDWMTKDELNEAIPPAYTEFIGKQLVKHLEILKQGVIKCESPDRKKGFASSYSPTLAK